MDVVFLISIVMYFTDVAFFRKTTSVKYITIRMRKTTSVKYISHG
jgi:hypothetical protein